MEHQVPVIRMKRRRSGSRRSGLGLLERMDGELNNRKKRKKKRWQVLFFFVS